MFDLFRSREKSVRILLGVLLGMVALSMLVYLIPGGLGGGGGATGTNTIAVVGDQKITTTDVQRAIERITRNQTNFPRSLLGAYVPSLVNQLVESKAMAYKAREIGLRVSDDELGSAIQSEFASEAGGKFDMNMYQMVLAQQGMTVPDFENERREAMLGMRLEALESQALVISDKDAKAEYQRKNLKVGLQYVAFSDKDFAAKVSTDPAAVKAYFDKNRAMFRTPEKRDLEVIVGTTAEFMQLAKISDQQLRQEYQDNIDTYRIPERVKVRHILIKTQGKPKEDVPKLKAKAQDLLNQLQHGGNFADLAKKNSDDPGSAQNGGELGWITHGQTVANFDKTAFALNPGQLSGLVETEYGFHIIQSEEKQQAHTQSFDEVKGQILSDLQKQVATDNLHKSVEAARTEIAKNPAQADAIAQKYNLRVVKVNGIANNGTLPDMNSPEMMNAVFAAPKGSATDVVNIDNQGKSGFAVVTNVIPARNADFAEVQGDVLQKYKAVESMRLAQEAAKAAADRARKGESLEAIAKSYGLQVKTAAPFTIDGAAEGIGSGSVLHDAFTAKIGDIVGPVSAQAGQFICRVSEKIPADMSQFAKNRDSIIQTLQSQAQSVQGPLFRNSVVSELKRRGKVKFNDDAIHRMMTNYQAS